VKYQQQIFNIL